MALVRISKELIADVKLKIKKVDASASRLLVEPLSPHNNPAVLDALHEAGLTKLWGAHRALMDTLPDGWIPTIPRMDIRVDNGDEIRIERDTPIPPNTIRMSYVDIALNSKDLPKHVTESLAKHHQALDAHVSKFEAIEKQLLSFLKNSKSLNAALVQYPDLALYIPSTTLERVNEVTERKAKAVKEAPAEIALDRDLVTSTGVLGALHNNQ